MVLGWPRLNRVTVVVALLIGMTYVAKPVLAADTWTQQGPDIDGTSSMDINGYAVAMSADGTSIAVGAPGNNNDTGVLRVFTWDGTAWNQRGNTLNGDSAGDYFGGSIAISSDGMTIAIGSYGSNTSTGLVRVFTYDAAGDQWVQLGSDIDGQATGDYFGFGVAMSSDGRTVAIGAPLDDNGSGVDAGQVSVFTWNGTAWAQRGADIDGEAAGDYSGYSVAMSADGASMAIGAPYNAGNGTRSGQMRVFTWNGSAWTQQGADIDGEAAEDLFSYSVAMSADGATMVIGAPGNDGFALGAGHVRVFTWNGTAWAQQGADIDGEGPSDQFGADVAMSADGTSIVGGAPTSDIGGVDRGRMRAFVWNGTLWAQRGEAIEGESAGDVAGWSVAMSAEGSVIAEGSPFNNDVAALAGQVRVFAWPSPPGVVPGPATYFTFYLPDGRECTSISPQLVQVGTMVELPGVDALCKTMPGSVVAGWTIPVPVGFTGAGSSSLPFNPGHRVRVIESQRFTLVPFDPVIQIDYDANIAADDSCTAVDVAHGSENGRVGYAWVPRVNFAMARTAMAAPCVPDGYELIGWNTRGDGSGQSLGVGEPLPDAWESQAVNHHRLYAVWRLV